MSTLSQKTPEERRAIALKAVATRRKNKEEELKRRQDAVTYRDGLLESIRASEKRLEDLAKAELFSTHAIGLTGTGLLSERQIVEASQPWEELIGVYFLVKGASVVYVGQSTNVHSRVHAHSAYMDFDGIAYIKCSKENLNKLESLYIHMLRPRLNGEHPSGMKMAPISLHGLLSTKE